MGAGTQPSGQPGGGLGGAENAGLEIDSIAKARGAKLDRTTPPRSKCKPLNFLRYAYCIIVILLRKM
ncbi:MAG: hypothetical protein HRU34_04020 [Richelia sp.]|nr:hypothetical protein [Richelia sp.]CDN10397.1 hypothetical protein RintRC_2314 [Richelia intracellularis]